MGQQQFIANSESTNNDAATVWNNNALDTESRIGSVENKTLSIVTTKQFGDGNNSIALAIDATQVADGPTIIELTPGKTYTITTTIEKTLTRSIEIRGNGATIVSSLLYPFTLLAENNSLTLSSDVAYNSKTLVVSDASGVSIGDIINITSDVVMSTSWTHYLAQDTRKVVSISGNTLTLDSPTNLSYTRSTETVSVLRYKNISVKIENLTINNTYSSTAACIRLWGLSGELKNISVKASSGGVKDGIWMYHCSNIDIYNPVLNGLYYGIPIYSSRFINIYDVRCENVAGHPVTIGQCSSNININGLVSQNCPGAVDSHPSFYVSYKNVIADGSNFNLRAWGMRLENAIFKNAPQLRVDTLFWTQLPAEALSKFPHLLTDYDLELINVKFTPDQNNNNLEDVVLISTNFKNIIVDNCELTGVMVEVNPVNKVQITNSRLGYFHHRSFNGEPHPCDIFLTNVTIDGDLYSRTEDCMRIYIGDQKAVFTNVRCVNNRSRALFGIGTFRSLLCINCDFGEWSEFIEVFNGIVLPATGYKFVNCNLVITNDAIVKADFEKFINCTGSIAGRSFNPINTKIYNLPDYPIADVRKFGAVGDGVTDDHAAFVSAVSSGLDIYIPNSATYKISDGITLQDGQKLIGNNNPVILYSPSGNYTTAVLLGNNCSVSGITFKGTGSAKTHANSQYTGAAIGGNSKSQCSIKNCKFEDFVFNYNASIVAFINCRGVNISDNFFSETNVLGTDISVSYRVSDLIVANNISYSDCDVFLAISAVGGETLPDTLLKNTEHSVITGNIAIAKSGKINTSGREGINIHYDGGYSYSIISNNIIVNFARHGIYLRGANIVGNDTGPNIVSGNIIRYCGGIGTLSSDISVNSGIKAECTLPTIISNNIIEKCGYKTNGDPYDIRAAGIEVSRAARNLTVTGNKVSDIFGDGIMICPTVALTTGTYHIDMIDINGNSVKNVTRTPMCIGTDAGATKIQVGMVNVRSNTIEMTSTNDYGIGITNPTSDFTSWAMIYNNMIRGTGTSGKYGIALNNTRLNADVYGNQIENCNIGIGSTRVTIAGIATGYMTHRYFGENIWCHNNIFNNCNKAWGASGSVDSTAQQIVSGDNKYINCTETLYGAAYYGLRFVAGERLGVNSSGQLLFSHFLDSLPIGTSAYRQGDRVIIRSPSSSQVPTYICTTAGSPGTWTSWVDSAGTRKDKQDTITFSSTPTINFDSGNGDNKLITLTGNVSSSTFSATRIGFYTLLIKQDGTGNRTFSFAVNVLGTPPSLSSSANSTTVYRLYFDGTNFHFS